MKYDVHKPIYEIIDEINYNKRDTSILTIANLVLIASYNYLAYSAIKLGASKEEILYLGKNIHINNIPLMISYLTTVFGVIQIKKLLNEYFIIKDSTNNWIKKIVNSLNKQGLTINENELKNIKSMYTRVIGENNAYTFNHENEEITLEEKILYDGSKPIYYYTYKSAHSKNENKELVKKI